MALIVSIALIDIHQQSGIVLRTSLRESGKGETSGGSWKSRPDAVTQGQQANSCSIVNRDRRDS